MNKRFGFSPYRLTFKKPILTSRGGMTHKKGWMLWQQQDDGSPQHIVAECNIIEGLSIDEEPVLLEELHQLCEGLTVGATTFRFESPAVQFTAECALQYLKYGQVNHAPNAFNTGMEGIPINGLIWMGTAEDMYQQTVARIQAGFTCIKLKIGALPFEDELELIRILMQEFGHRSLQWRLDANGAFTAEEALRKLEKLSVFPIHSIEQPIQPRQWKAMRKISDHSPIPIALDEELIGRFTHQEKENLIREIQPQYLILKPGIMGGFQTCEEWIALAEKNGIGWWATSALESNIGLNAIAQWAYTQQPHIIHGLGTGSLYVNNFASPLLIQNGKLFYQPNLPWNDHLA